MSTQMREHPPFDEERGMFTSSVPGPPRVVAAAPVAADGASRPTGAPTGQADRRTEAIGLGKADDYGDPSSIVWSLYLTEVEKEDKVLADNINADTNGVLVFTGLFAAVVAAFIIESYGLLQPDSGARTVALLEHISRQIAAASNGSSSAFPSALADPDGVNAAFHPLPSALRINVLWFLSLLMSLTCALLATLMQQWTRRYLSNTRDAQRAGSPQRQGRIHAYLFQGLRTFRFKAAVETLPALLHTSVGLFFAGLVDFLLTVNKALAYVVLAYVGIIAVLYAALTILPSIWSNTPYGTPLSSIPFRYVVTRILPVAMIIPFYFCGMIPELCSPRTEPELPYRARRSTMQKLEQAANSVTRLGRDTLDWTLTVVLDDDAAVEKLAAGLDGFLVTPAHAATKDEMLEILHARRFAARISQLLASTVTASRRAAVAAPLTGEARARALLCLQVLLNPVVMNRDNWAAARDGLFGAAQCLTRLRMGGDAEIAIRSCCVWAMLLSQDPHHAQDYPATLGSLQLRPSGNPETFDGIGAKDLTRGAKFVELSNFVVFVQGILRVLPLMPSPDSLDIAWRTLSAIGDNLLSAKYVQDHGMEWLWSHPSMVAELEALRPEIVRKADEEAERELATLLHGETPHSPAMKSPYTQLYVKLKPLYDWLPSLKDKIKKFDEDVRESGLEKVQRRNRARAMLQYMQARASASVALPRPVSPFALIPVAHGVRTGTPGDSESSTTAATLEADPVLRRDWALQDHPLKDL